MTAILAEFAAVYQPDFALINIFTVVVIAAVAAACAISLRKKGDKPA
jgi:hypothetical protein